MSVVAEILREAKALVVNGGHYAPPEGMIVLAVNARYERVLPWDPAAVKWMSVGALCKVARSTRPSGRMIIEETSNAGWEAYGLLQHAAELQGHLWTSDADRAGLPATIAMFDKALTLVPSPASRARRAAA